MDQFHLTDKMFCVSQCTSLKVRTVYRHVPVTDDSLLGETCFWLNHVRKRILFQVCTAGKTYTVPARNPYKYANIQSSNDRRLLRLTSAQCCGSLVLCHQLQAAGRHWHTCRDIESTQCLSLLVSICFTLYCLFVCNNMIHHFPREISLWDGRVETCLGLVTSFCQDIKLTCD